MGNAQIKKWMHISEMGGNYWVLPIYSSLNGYAKRKSISGPSQDFYDLGLYISIKLDILPVIINRLNSGYKKLLNQVKVVDDSYVCKESRDGYALDVNPEQKHEMLIDIDSFFFEFNSCSELICNFLYSIYSYSGKEMPKKKIGDKLRQIIVQNKIASDWFVKLDKHRNFFIHDGAPYIAFDMTNAPNEYELLIMKKNIKNFENENEFIRLADLDEIAHGFLASTMALQEYLIEYLKKMR